MATSQCLIYALQDPISFEIRYVGKSCSGLNRIKRHFRESEFKYDKNLHKVNWIKSLKNQGLTPNILIIQEHIDFANLFKISKSKVCTAIKHNKPINGYYLRKL